MSDFDAGKLQKIYNQRDLMDSLVENGIIKEQKFLNLLAYEKELEELQMELVRLQQFVIENKKRVLILFEGRDAAGKGGSIKRITMSINPKKYRVVALPKPTEKEQGQWYFQRYLKHLPNEGEIVFFDRSWYNRAVVEPVFGFCTEKQHDLFMNQVNDLERMLMEDDIIFIKFFLTISKEEQADRLDARREDPLKRWKVGGLDEQALEKWDVYSEYIKKMLKKTKTTPWVEIETDHKKNARLEIIKYILSHIPDFEPNKKWKNNKEVVKVRD